MLTRKERLLKVLRAAPSNNNRREPNLDPNDTIVIDGPVGDVRVNAECIEIALPDVDDTYNYNILMERLAKLSGGVAVTAIGGGYVQICGQRPKKAFP